MSCFANAFFKSNNNIMEEKQVKKFLAVILAMVLMVTCSVSSLATEPTVHEVETTLPTINVVGNESKMKIVVVTPAEMDALIANHEAGIDTYNYFDDHVLLTITDEGSYCKVVLLNNGFPFDRCDVTGKVLLYDINMRVVGNATVAERKLVYGVARVIKIYPIGGKFETGSYSLTVSDGDAGTLYTGTF